MANLKTPRLDPPPALARQYQSMPTLDDLLDVDAVALLALRRSHARREVNPTESEVLAHQVVELFHGRPLEIAVAAVHRAVAIIEKPLVQRASSVAHPLKTVRVKVRIPFNHGRQKA